MSKHTTIVPLTPKLPADVLHHVFEVGAFDTDHFCDEFHFPMLVASVSQEWRQVALAFSKLWTTILITQSCSLNPASLYEPDASANTFPMAALCLKRSRNQPLTVKIDLCNPDYIQSFYDKHNPARLDDGFMATISAFLVPLLVPHAHRFKALTVLSNTYLPLVNILRHFSAVPMPQLESWVTRRENSDHCVHPQFKPRALKGAFPLFMDQPNVGAQPLWSQIKNIELSGVSLDWVRFSPRNLHTLTITYLAFDARPSFASLRRILLASAHSLQKLDIQGAMPPDIFSQTHPFPPPIYLPVLRELALGYTLPQEVFPFVYCVRLPALRALHLCDARRTYELQKFGFTMGNQSVRDATCLFEAMIEHARTILHRLDSLTLKNVLLSPEEPGSCQCDADAPPLNPPIPISAYHHTPFRFLRMTANLKHLTLYNPCPRTRLALNTPVPFMRHPPLAVFSFVPLLLSQLHFRNTPIVHMAAFFRARTIKGMQPAGEVPPTVICSKLARELDLVTMDGGLQGLLGRLAGTLGPSWKTDVGSVARRLNVTDETTLGSGHVLDCGNDDCDCEICFDDTEEEGLGESDDDDAWA